MLLVSIQCFASLLGMWIAWYFLSRRVESTIDHIPGPPGASWLLGSVDQLMSFQSWGFHSHIAKTYGSVVRVKGFCGANNLYIFDPKTLHHILIKDFHIFEEPDSLIEINRILFGEGLLTSFGERHRVQRKMLNPAFSVANLRDMTDTFYQVTHALKDTFLKMTQDGPREIDIHSWLTRLMLELVGQSGLGYSFDSLTEDSVPHRYGVASRKLLSSGSSDIAFVNLIIPYLTAIGTARFRRTMVNLMPFESIKQVRDILNCMHETSIEIIESKKVAIAAGDEVLASEIGKGKDIISILLRANMQAADSEKLSEAELHGQVTTLTFAATDTTSSALTRLVQELSNKKGVQNMLREEIRKAKQVNAGRDLSYDDLSSLPLLDAVCKETLRLYPPLPLLPRVARQDTVLPVTTPIKGTNNEYIREIFVPQGTNIHLSILNANTDPDVWGQDSEEWKPERWLKPLPKTLVDAHIPGVYSHLLTFLGGPKSCIGFKFSQLEMKVTLALLLDFFEFSPSDKVIDWQMTGIATPHVDNNVVPSLPTVITQIG